MLFISMHSYVAHFEMHYIPKSKEINRISVRIQVHISPTGKWGKTPGNAVLLCHRKVQLVQLGFASPAITRTLGAADTMGSGLCLHRLHSGANLGDFTLVFLYWCMESNKKCEMVWKKSSMGDYVHCKWFITGWKLIFIRREHSICRALSYRER